MDANRCYDMDVSGCYWMLMDVNGCEWNVTMGFGLAVLLCFFGP